MQSHKTVIGERARALNLAGSKDQAAATREYARGFLQASKILGQSVVEDSKETIKLKGGVEICSHASSFRSVRGGTLILCILDEIAYFRDEASANPDQEIYTAVRPSLVTTDAMLVGISSPYRRSGLLFEKWKQSFAKDDSACLVIQAPTRVLNPTIPQKEVDRALADDPEAGASEWLAAWRSDLSDFIDRAAIEACVATDVRERAPEFRHRYLGFVDPSGGRSDSMTLAIAHHEGDTTVLDAIREAKK